MSVIQDHEIGRFYVRARVEIDPVVHDPERLSIVVVQQLVARIVTTPELVGHQMPAQEVRLLFHLRCQRLGSSQVGDALALV